MNSFFYNRDIIIVCIRRYLKKTSVLGIVVASKKTLDCQGFSVSDWAGDTTDGKTASGYCSKLSGGGVVS